MSEKASKRRFETIAEVDEEEELVERARVTSKKCRRKRMASYLKNYFTLSEKLPVIKEFPEGVNGFTEDTVEESILKFSLMVVGKAGLGKTTFIKSMFLDCSTEWKLQQKTLGFETIRVKLEERKTAWIVTIVDTPGYQIGVDNENIWSRVTSFVESKYADYFIEGDEYHDERVHCLIYFIDPNGLTPLDITYLKNVDKKSNVIPVIGKADSLTYEECQNLKRSILLELYENDVKTFTFPNTGFLNNVLQDRMPFAFIGSTRLEKLNGKEAKTRQYPWGSIDVQCMEYSDFGFLELAIRCNFEYFITATDGLFDDTYDFYFSTSKTPKGAVRAEMEQQLAQLEREKAVLVCTMEKVEGDIKRLKENLIN